MDPCRKELVGRLDLKTAITAEAAQKRNLLPDEPGWHDIARNATSVGRWLANQLRSGWTPAPEQVVAVRKAGHGIRPVPVWSPPDRIIYRALVSLLTEDAPPLDRSAKKYLEFINGPYSYSQSLIKPESTSVSTFFTQVFSSPFKYVVVSDITAFYQYVDHGILAAELTTRGHDDEVITALMQLLQEVQGRSYGLPQLLDASDELSEIYIDRVERAMIRAGAHIWRFNDDFRIGCEDYPAALNAIELLGSAARDNGLVLNEYKTVTYGYMKYVGDHLGLMITEDQTVIAPDEVEDIVGDYTDDFGPEDLDDAASLIENAVPGAASPHIDIRDPGVAGIRRLRRAFNSLAAHERMDALSSVKSLLDFVPSLTPTLMRYCALAATPTSPERGAALAAIEAIMYGSSLNEWQKLWVVDTLGEVTALDEGSFGDAATLRSTWVEAVARHSNSAVARAAAWTTLADSGSVSTRVIARQMDEAPTCLYTFYLSGVKAAFQRSQSDEDRKIYEALARESTFNRALLQ